MIANYDLANDDGDLMHGEISGYPKTGFMENEPFGARSENSVFYSPTVLNTTEAAINVTEIL